MKSTTFTIETQKPKGWQPKIKQLKKEIKHQVMEAILRKKR